MKKSVTTRRRATAAAISKEAVQLIESIIGDTEQLLVVLTGEPSRKDVGRYDWYELVDTAKVKARSAGPEGRQVATLIEQMESLHNRVTQRRIKRNKKAASKLKAAKLKAA